MPTFLIELRDDERGSASLHLYHVPLLEDESVSAQAEQLRRAYADADLLGFPKSEARVWRTHENEARAGSER
jgi:hypothetical protein